MFFFLAVYRLLPSVCEKPDTFLSTIQAVLLSSLCFKASLSKGLGLGMVVFATVIKIPQVLKVARSKSAEGLSLAAMLVEQFGYVYNLATHYRESYPITTYGDFIAIMLQNMALLVLAFKFSKRTAQGVLVVSAFFAMLFFMCSELCPIEWLRFLTTLNALVSLGSRVPQIYANFAARSTGALSVVTTAGMAIGSCARVFTTYMDIPSRRILLGYVTSASCHLTLLTQILMYGGSSSSTASSGKKQELKKKSAKEEEADEGAAVVKSAEEKKKD